MTTVTITTPAEFETFKKTTPLFLADFWKDNCMNCKMLELSFQKAAQTSPAPFATLTLAKLKLEDLGEEIFHAHAVRQAPTLILFRDGRETARLGGFIAPEKITALLA
ncbi:Thioredoxin [Opitutaceae bacterium TAV1]|nr:Thioredoxin [Opitutaceae bacterium TAV1]